MRAGLLRRRAGWNQGRRSQERDEANVGQASAEPGDINKTVFHRPAN
jgi:hypothetical protein